MMIYILELKDACYYIGKFSIQQLKNGIGPSWTKLHPPIRVINQYFNYDDELDEDSLIHQYMEKYGIDKVRGGSYISIELSEYQKRNLENRFNKVDKNDNKNNYFIDIESGFKTVIYNNKPFNTSNNTEVEYSTNKSTNVCMYCEMKLANEEMLKKHEELCIDSYYTKSRGKNINCERCGRDTHVSQFCRAKTTIDGYDI
jgi:hypothetical protein